MALFAFDIDGTIDADPTNFLAIMQALRAAGNKIAICTGCAGRVVGPEDIAEKAQYLRSLGVGDAYDMLVVFPDPPHVAKADWCKNNGVNVLFDNSRENAELTSPFCTVLVPWSTREGNKNGDS